MQFDFSPPVVRGANKRVQIAIITPPRFNNTRNDVSVSPSDIRWSEGTSPSARNAPAPLRNLRGSTAHTGLAPGFQQGPPDSAGEHRFTGIAGDAHRVATELVSKGLHVEGGRLFQLLPNYVDNSLDYDDLAPFITTLLDSSLPQTQVHQEEGTSNNVQDASKKAHTRNITEKDKNAELTDGNVLLKDVEAMWNEPTNKCRCESHAAINLQAVLLKRQARAKLSTSQKRTAMLEVMRELCSTNKHGARKLHGKLSLAGLPLCAKIWQLILKVCTHIYIPIYIYAYVCIWTPIELCPMCGMFPKSMKTDEKNKNDRNIRS
jgi:hypothetical protein